MFLSNIFLLLVMVLVDDEYLSFAISPNDDGDLICPYKCSCNSANITCIEKQLTVVPDFRKINFNPTMIDLTGDDIEELKATHLASKKLQMLERLSFDDNSLFYIEVHAFSSLQKLQYLNLANNMLDEIPQNIIEKNKDLIELNLSGNLFSAKTPVLISTTLKILDLSFSKVSHFEEKHLRGLPNLQVLHLHANNLKHLDYNILGNTKLTYINLSYNSWKCRCDTIKLFDYVVNTGLMKVDRPIQCMHPNKWYEDIYDADGPMHHNKLCKNAHKLRLNATEQPLKKLENLKIDTTIDHDDEEEKSIDEKKAETENYASVLAFEIWIVITVLTALLLGIGLTLFVIWKKLKRVTESDDWGDESYYNEVS